MDYKCKTWSLWKTPNSAKSYRAKTKAFLTLNFIHQYNTVTNLWLSSIFPYTYHQCVHTNINYQNINLYKILSYKFK